MNRRLSYMGGAKQTDRMAKDKLRSLRKALLYSYQAETIFVPQKAEDQIYNEFACLINPNRLTMEADDKVLSIPFEDIPLDKPVEGTTTAGLQKIDLAVGDVVHWKETNTHWILYQRYLQEDAYYRFAMRQCDSQIEFENGAKFWAYVKGPDEKGIDWVKSKRFIFNELNYTLEIYISKTTETLELFQRFKKIKLFDRNWEVQAKDDITTEGIIVAYLKEDYSNKWAPVQVKDPEAEPAPDPNNVYIIGESKIHPYDIVSYYIHNSENGWWTLSNQNAKILKQDGNTVKIEVVTGKSGDVTLFYSVDGIIMAKMPITILSL